jgi:hypothetical protein
MYWKKLRAHRNPDYLNWLRLNPCVISHEPAEVVHHVRLGTNGGMGLKPSDYFCIPLLNNYHTTGKDAVHMIGEKSFIEKFNLDYEALFIHYLKKYLHRLNPDSLEEISTPMLSLDLLITTIENQRTPSPIAGLSHFRQNQKKKKSFSTKPLKKSLYLKRKKKSKKKKFTNPFNRQLKRL